MLEEPGLVPKSPALNPSGQLQAVGPGVMGAGAVGHWCDELGWALPAGTWPRYRRGPGGHGCGHGWRDAAGVGVQVPTANIPLAEASPCQGTARWDRGGRGLALAPGGVPGKELCRREPPCPRVSPPHGASPLPRCLEPCQPGERLWVCLPLLVIARRRFVAAPRGLRHLLRSPIVLERFRKIYI